MSIFKNHIRALTHGRHLRRRNILLYLATGSRVLKIIYCTRETTKFLLHYQNLFQFTEKHVHELAGFELQKMSRKLLIDCKPKPKKIRSWTWYVNTNIKVHLIRWWKKIENFAALKSLDESKLIWIGKIWKQSLSWMIIGKKVFVCSVDFFFAFMLTIHWSTNEYCISIHLVYVQMLKWKFCVRMGRADSNFSFKFLRINTKPTYKYRRNCME